MNRRLIPHLAWLAGLLVLVQFNAAAAKPASPGVEVKLFLDPSLSLDARNQPSRDVLAAFQVTGNPVTIKMQFLDGRGHELHKAGWNVRFRTVQGKDKMELTYKRRYPAPSGLAAALARAEQDGFEAGEKKDYEPELEWGYQRETLTFSNEKPKESTNPTLPSLANARTLAVNEMPGKLQRFRAGGWAKGILSGASIYGPVGNTGWHIEAVTAEIDRARGEPGAQIRSVTSFLLRCEGLSEDLDYLGGRSGALASAARLLEAPERAVLPIFGPSEPARRAHPALA